MSKLMKLQVPTPPTLSETMRGIPKNNRSVVVGYALMRLFASTDRKDVDFLKVVSHESESVSGGIHTPRPDEESLKSDEGGRGEMPLAVTEASSDIIADARGIAGGLMDDD